MYNSEIGKKIEHLSRLVKRAKTEETKAKHIAEINKLYEILFKK